MHSPIIDMDAGVKNVRYGCNWVETTSGKKLIFFIKMSRLDLIYLLSIIENTASPFLTIPSDSLTLTMDISAETV